jgi:hypothetical protein
MSSTFYTLLQRYLKDVSGIFATSPKTHTAQLCSLSPLKTIKTYQPHPEAQTGHIFPAL